MPLYDQVPQSQASVIKVQFKAHTSAARPLSWTAALLAQSPDDSQSQSATESDQVRINLVVPYSMSLPKTWIDNAPKGVGGRRSTVYGDTNTTARITTSHSLPNGDDGRLGLLIPKAPNRVIFDEETGPASPLAKKFAGLAGQNWKYNQLTTSNDADYHISRIETLTVHGLPAVRFAIHCKTMPIESVKIPLPMGEENKFVPDAVATNQSITFSANNDEDFEKSKSVFEDAIESIR
jgi:hypothetical protein